MRVILFGASGMVGQGALRECLLDPEVERVLVIGRSSLGQSDPKLVEQLVTDVGDLSSIEGELEGYDACFFCLGVSSNGLDEATYRKITRDIAVDAAEILVKRSPEMTFVFISGQGADATGTSRVMWSRVKGEAENAILAMPFKASYVFRPGFIRPLHGIRSRTKMYNVVYAILWPFVPIIMAIADGTTTEKLGRAMLVAAKRGASKRTLERRDINALVA